jgi:predicted TIM-barrel fold metal-dependent hydrolase
MVEASEVEGNILRPCQGIIGFVDLRLGDDARALLEAHQAEAKGRLKAIRNVSAWDGCASLKQTRANPPRHLLYEQAFRRGFKCLAKMDLAYDAWLYHTQLTELTDLATAFPDTTIVLNHVGGPVGTGPYAGRREEVFAVWRSDIKELADRPNVFVKLGGLGMRRCGFDLHNRPTPPTSQELATLWRPYIETCIEAFTPSRCMFESNFPVDREACSYAVLWNAFKRIVTNLSPSEKAAVFSDSARAAYRLA